MTEILNPRPSDLSEKHDSIIQLVAKYVTLSVDGAKYQYKLVQKTLHNTSFAFLEPTHKHHAYYQYLMHSYRFWYSQGASGGGGDASEYAGQYAAQTDFSQQDPTYHYTGMNYQAGPVSYDDQPALYATANTDHNQGDGVLQAAASAGFSGAYDMGAMPKVAIGASAKPPAVRQRTPDEDDDDDEDANPKFKFIIENGVRKAVPQ